MVDSTATARVQRLIRWLEHFKSCFGHRAQVLSLRSYVQGVFSDSELQAIGRDNTLRLMPTLRPA